MVELVKTGRDLFQLAVKEQHDKVCSTFLEEPLYTTL